MKQHTKKKKNDFNRKNYIMKNITIEQQLEVLKNISYKEILFHLAEKGSIQDFNFFINKIGQENVINGVFSFESKNLNKKLYKATNKDNLNIIEVIVTNKRSLDFIKTLYELRKEQSFYIFREFFNYFIKDSYNQNIIKLIIQNNLKDHYLFFKNIRYKTDNYAFIESLKYADKKLFKEVLKDFEKESNFFSLMDNNNKTSYFSITNNHNNEKEENNFFKSVCLVINNLQHNELFKEEFHIIKNRPLFIADLVFYAIENSQTEIFNFIKDIDIFLLKNKKGNDLFDNFKNKEELLIDFLSFNKYPPEKFIKNINNTKHNIERNHPKIKSYLEKNILQHKINANQKPSIKIKRL